MPILQFVNFCNFVLTANISKALENAKLDWQQASQQFRDAPEEDNHDSKMFQLRHDAIQTKINNLFESTKF